MQLSFSIDDRYLLAHTLASMGPGAFSTSPRNATVVDVQNEAWRVSQPTYDLLAGRLYPLVIANIGAIASELPKFFQAIVRSSPFKKLRGETEHYLEFCAEQWENNRERTTQVVHNLTGFNLDQSFTVYVTHPSLRNGHLIDDTHIAWGHHEDWPNYTTVYLWHEILHAYFERNDLDHALIQFIADNELRVQLNGGAYPPFVGHSLLFPTMDQLLPQWKRYLVTKRPRDIAALRHTTENGKGPAIG
ncbi:MAG: hypothetical protein Q7R80_04030 [bacterium]|nr:hypothetical protein [bacterium]